MKRLLTLFLMVLLISPCFSASSIIIGVREKEDGIFEGVIAHLEVIVKDGENRVYMDTLPLTEIDTQASARLAKEVACETLGLDCSQKDFFYTIRGEFPMIGGPSAGAAMTVLTMSELTQKSVSSNIAMTGTINPDGSIGSIGGILDKSISASNYGIQTFLVPQGQLLEASNYSFKNNMTVLEVSTIREAYSIFTNTAFEELSDDIAFEEFNNFMKPLSDDLIAYSELLLEEAVILKQESELTGENFLVIEFLLNNSLEQKKDMMNLYNNLNYYSAASYAVRSSINSLYTIYLLNYFAFENKEDYILSLLNSTLEDLNHFEQVINQPFILDHINDLEAVNIAMERFFEAKSLYNESSKAFLVNDTPSALYNLAFTQVRLKTSESWLGIKESFNNNIYIEFNQNLLQELALSRIENANTMITYAESVEYSVYTINAREHLRISINSYEEGDYIYSLFESLKSLSNANLAMQLRGITLEQVNNRIELSKKQARQNINLVQSNNITPILALSYYEYSETFEESDPAQALIFLEYSKQLSLLTVQMINHIDSSITRPLFFIPTNQEIGTRLTFAVIGVITGLILVFSILYRLFI